MFEHFKSEGHGGFLGNVSITLIDKTDRKDPKRRENYWMRTLTTYAPFGLNIEDSVWPIPFSSINVAGGLTFLVFVGILVRLGLDLEQFFGIFGIFYIIYFLIINFLFCVTYFYASCYFLLHVSIVSIVWCKILYCLPIYYSYLYYCQIKCSFVICISIA